MRCALFNFQRRAAKECFCSFEDKVGRLGYFGVDLEPTCVDLSKMIPEDVWQKLNFKITIKNI